VHPSLPPLPLDRRLRDERLARQCPRSHNWSEEAEVDIGERYRAWLLDRPEA